MVLAISDPIAVSATATSASATTTSISVKPARPRSRSQLDRHKLDTSGEPIDANLESLAQPRQLDRAPAGSSRWKKVDGAAGGALIAALGEQRFDRNIVRQLHRAPGHAGADRARRRADFGADPRAAAHGGVAVLLEQGRGLDRIGLEPRIGGAARQRRQDHGGEQRDDRDDADDFEQGESDLRTGAANPKFAQH